MVKSYKKVYIPNDKSLRLVRFEGISRRQNQFESKIEFCFWKSRNIVEKGEKAGYQHFPIFPQCSKGLFLKVFKSQDSVVKS